MRVYGVEGGDLNRHPVQSCLLLRPFYFTLAARLPGWRLDGRWVRIRLFRTKPFVEVLAGRKTHQSFGPC